MARVDASVPVCGTLIQPDTLPCACPFRVVHTFDEQFGLTDGLVQCGCCQAYYLLELTRWPDAAADARTFRVLAVDTDNAERFIQNVARDYCDLQRHRQELQALQVSARLSAWQLTLDVAQHLLLQVNKIADGTTVALVSWREQES